MADTLDMEARDPPLDRDTLAAMRRASAMVATLVLFGALVGSLPAEAQRRGRARASEPTDEERAAALFREAVELYRGGEFESAATLLRRAHELDPEPVLLFNLARALEASNRHLEAAETYARYLTDAPEAEDRAAIETLIANLRARAEAEAAASEQAADGGPADARAGNAQAGDDASDATSVAPPPLPPPPPSRAWGGWLLFGAGAVIGASGIPLGVFARDTNDAAATAATHEEAVAHRDDARRFQRTANALFGLGGALSLGGLLWALLARREPDARPLSLELGPTSVALRVRLR